MEVTISCSSMMLLLQISRVNRSVRKKTRNCVILPQFVNSYMERDRGMMEQVIRSVMM